MSRSAALSIASSMSTGYPSSVPQPTVGRWLSSVSCPVSVCDNQPVTAVVHKNQKRRPVIHRASTAIALLFLVGCSAPVPAVTPAPTPAFAIATVRQSFTSECVDPIVVDELFCEQVQIEGMTADGDILNVPTTLAVGVSDRASAICAQLAVAHFDAAGKDLGFRFIGVLDRNGGHAAACSVK